MTNNEFAEGYIRLFETSCVGGNCNVVLCDMNLGNDTIEWCYDWLDKNYHNMPPEIQDIQRDMLNTLLFTPKKRRIELIDYARNEYWKKCGSPNAVY